MIFVIQTSLNFFNLIFLIKIFRQSQKKKEKDKSVRLKGEGFNPEYGNKLENMDSIPAQCGLSSHGSKITE
jgi:hypothetical protein